MDTNTYTSILNHCFAAYKGIITATEEYHKACAEYYGAEAEATTKMSEQFTDMITETKCFESIRDLIGDVALYHNCDCMETTYIY